MRLRIAALGLLLALAACDDFEASYASCVDAGACLPPVTDPPGEPSADTSTLEQTLSTVVADGTASTQLTLTLRDAHRKPIPNHAVLMSASGQGNRFSPQTGTTDVQGVFVSRLSATRPGARTISVTAGALVLTAQVTFVAGKPDSTTSTLAALPASAAADGTEAIQLTVTLIDVAGNPCADVPVTFGATGTGNVFDPSTATATDDTGVLKASLRSTKAEAKTVTATALGTTLSTAVTFTPGPFSAAASSVTAVPAQVVADGFSTSTITVALRDAQGNGVPSQAFTLAASGTGNALAATSGLSGATGTFSTTLSSTVAEAKNVTVTIGGQTLSTSLTFTPGPPLASSSSIVVTPASLLADGATLATITATLADKNGNAVTGAPVTFGVTGTGNTLGAANGTTDSAGVFTSTLTSTVAEQKTVSVTSGTMTRTTAVTFTAGAPSTQTSSLTVTPGSLVANGSATAQVTVVLEDAQGNPIASAPVMLAATGTGNTFTPVNGLTTAAGQFQATLSSTVAEPKVITATSGTFTLTGGATFVPGPVSTAKSSVTATPGSVIADGTTSTALTVTLRDAQGNSVPGQPVSLTVSGTSNTLTPSSGVTADGGVFPATLASTKGESKTVTATSGAVQVSTSVTFRPLVSASTSTVTVSSASVPADGFTTSTITVTLLDSTSGPVAGETVTLAYTGSATPSPASAVTSASGVATFTLSSSSATTGTLTATAMGVQVTQAPTLTFVPVYPVAGTITGLTTSGLMLATSNLPDLTVTSGATTFAFARGLPEGDAYGVSVKTQPGGGVHCTAYAASGTISSATPVNVTVICHAPWTKVSTGSDQHTLALASDGTVWAWGLNGYGQVGLGDAQFIHTIPGKVGSGFTDIAAGRNYSLAIKSNGTLWAWGSAMWGEMGYVPSQAVLSPVQVGSANTYSKVWASTEFSMAMRSDGALLVFGNNTHGQLGLGDTTPRSSPTVLGYGYSTVALGDGHVLGLKTDGSLWVWGWNYQGQLGLGDTADRLVPTPLGTGYASAAAGGMHSLAVATDGGTLLAWGYDSSGELGLGDAAFRTSVKSPTLVDTGFTSVAAAGTQSLGFKTDGSLWQWGQVTRVIGPSCATTPPSGYGCSSPEPIGFGYASAVAGWGYSLALSPTGLLWVWGYPPSALGLENGPSDAPTPGP